MKISVKYAVTGALSGAANGFFRGRRRVISCTAADFLVRHGAEARVCDLSRGNFPAVRGLGGNLLAKGWSTDCAGGAVSARRRGRRRAGRKVIRQVKGRLAAPCIRRTDSLWRRPCRPAAVSAVLAVAIGLLTGILSGFGIGGGSLLLLYLTLLKGQGSIRRAASTCCIFSRVRLQR